MNSSDFEFSDKQGPEASEKNQRFSVENFLAQRKPLFVTLTKDIMLDFRRTECAIVETFISYESSGFSEFQTTDSGKREGI